MTLVRKDKTGGFLEVRRYKDLLIQLVSRDLKLKYRRSCTGIRLERTESVADYARYVRCILEAVRQEHTELSPFICLSAEPMYDFVVGATNKAMDGITSNAALLEKTYVSKYMFPLAKVTSCMVDYVLSLGALLIVLIFTGSPFCWTMLLFPLITLEAYIFACGMGFFLAQMHVFFRDTRYIYNAFTTAWMYASAIFDPVDILPDWLMSAWLRTLNPLYIYIKQFRDIAYSRLHLRYENDYPRCCLCRTVLRTWYCYFQR